MSFEISDAQSLILREIGNKRLKRKDIAVSYACCITARYPIDWHLVNERIRCRWSDSGLTWIKEQAWKKIKALQAEEPEE